jgi:hypothetical protein
MAWAGAAEGLWIGGGDVRRTCVVATLSGVRDGRTSDRDVSARRGVVAM